MKPRYEIHSIGMPDIVEPVPTAKVEQRDRAARALFAATEMVSGNKFETEFGRTMPQDANSRPTTPATRRDSSNWPQQLTRACQQNRSAGDLTKVAAKTDLRDPWDTPLRVDRLDWDPQHRYYLVRSAGPDKRFDTADDFSTILEVRTRKIAGPPTSDQIAIDLQIEHDRGPFNGLAEVVGSVKDQMARR